MNKLVVSAAVAALFVVGAPAALAQDDRDCNQAQREVARVELRLSALVTQEREAEIAVRDTAREALRVAQVALEAAIGDAIPAAREARDAARAALERAQDALNTDSRQLANLRVELTAAIADRDEDCRDLPPAPTTPPATTPPAVPVDEFDCDDFAVRADAQAKLNETLPEDPHKLDLDSDGIACEVAELTVPPTTTPPPAAPAIVDNDVVVTPNGGVNTGGGPA
jgi:hypothetical protein